ncbi:MAG: hypothetical protein ISR74_05435 [Candidatus Thioglobus sp.]|nr:hypothetical protein [Candidatus Thioglobus sp.]
MKIMLSMVCAILYTTANYAEELPNPFTPHVFIKQVLPPPPMMPEGVPGEDVTVEDQIAEHPLKALDLTKYFVKGIILSDEQAIVLVNAGPGKDYFMQKGDTLGKSDAVIEEILQDRMVLMQDEQKVVIKVRNNEETARYGY